MATLFLRTIATKADSNLLELASFINLLQKEYGAYPVGAGHSEKTIGMLWKLHIDPFLALVFVRKHSKLVTSWRIMDTEAHV